ncbi:Hpt domain-containing protein [Lachnospiraceae bacterium OttesenSCG-928-D06]|nr:Hpt domain-containing protein [Lachnospiraceae bacterium OttesenSCG-928-D06]
MELVELYQAIDVDVNVVVGRLGLTERHLKKYLGKFRNNKEFTKLTDAVAAKDYENVEWAAHTLKGVASNLGLDLLQVTFQKMVDSVRSNHTEEIDGLYATAKVDYEKVMGLLAQVEFDD